MAMKVKRYEAPTLQEALQHVKRDLGSEAVILQTRKFNRGGVFGLLGKSMVEVLAATDMESTGQSADRREQPRAAARPSGSAQSAASRKPASTQQSASPKAEDELRSELREVKSALQTLLHKSRAEEQEPVNPYPPIFGSLYLQLIENDVSDALAQDIIRAMDDSLSEEDKEDDDAARAALERQLRRLLKVSGAITLSGREPKTVALVGPTGVGKTTTIAKIATVFALQKKKNVGIITADTYRIAAVEQIKVYSEILDVPVKVVYTAEDMKRAVDSFADRDLILIDTAGRSHWDAARISEIRDLLAVCYPLEIHLTLSAHIRYKDMLDISDKFRPLAYNHLIFTKLDETSTYGNLINLIASRNVGVSYLCFGQNVPGEIEAASPGALLNLVMGKPLKQAVNAGRER
jgi:flagellar biosynthesis protein FlhF